VQQINDPWSEVLIKPKEILQNWRQIKNTNPPQSCEQIYGFTHKKQKYKLKYLEN
jgi:hypothetical protein